MVRPFQKLAHADWPGKGLDPGALKINTRHAQARADGRLQLHARALRATHSALQQPRKTTSSRFESGTVVQRHRSAKIKMKRKWVILGAPVHSACSRRTLHLCCSSRSLPERRDRANKLSIMFIERRKCFNPQGFNQQEDHAGRRCPPFWSIVPNDLFLSLSLCRARARSLSADMGSCYLVLQHEPQRREVK